MSPRGAAAVLAGLVLAVGVILGFSIRPTLSDPVLGTITCGSAFAPSSDAEESDIGVGLVGVTSDFQAQCSDKLTGPRIVSWTLVGVSALVLLFVGLTWNSGRPSVPASPLP